MTSATAIQPAADELSLPSKDAQSAEPEEAQTNDPGVSIDDVVKDAEYYVAEQIERLLGIAPRVFFAGHREHSGTIFTQGKGSGEYVELRGSQIKR